jgi:hypothetical protein
VATHVFTLSGTVSGDDNNVVTVTTSTSNTAAPGAFRYLLINTTDNLPLAEGRFDIRPAAEPA